MAESLKGLTSCMGYQQITGVSSATALTVPVVNSHGLKQQPTLAFIIPEEQAVRWRDDGVDPTATVGMPLGIGEALVYDGDLTKIRFFEQTSGAILNVSYYA